jgi:hypothetical protein
MREAFFRKVNRMPPRPNRPRKNLSIRSVDPSGRIAGGFDVRNISREKVGMLTSAAAKALANIDPSLTLRAAETQSTSRGDNVKVSLPHSTPARKASVSFADIPKERWDQIFGKKKGPPGQLRGKPRRRK